MTDYFLLTDDEVSVIVDALHNDADRCIEQARYDEMRGDLALAAKMRTAAEARRKLAKRLRFGEKPKIPVDT